MNKFLLENQICFKMHAISRLLTSHYRPLLDKLDITYPQYLVMLVLWEEEALSVKELGEQLYLDSGTLTPLLKRMESKGILERKRSEVDERSLIVRLTDSGMNMKVEAECIPDEIVKSLDMNKEEYDFLKSRLNEILNKLNQK
ncbi:MarR family winged helix-turn-helix transcriptional regulator [Fulvivirga sediminis]|uniref:MarR family transcriptional regulator n=1 Tax=Fulvivirga sediminis TaxID=2803949 RepID=A0A937JZH2_9BACT|nr:MarR family transcriptional regulator [Fulvivirga sediminis]MBL3655196.1 MarR family transcriptional regulator [Fulvivirga sediminis]